MVGCRAGDDVARRQRVATAALASKKHSEYRLAYSVLGIIGILGVILFVSVLTLIWRANSFKKKLVHYKHLFTVLQRKSFEIALNDAEAADELLKEVKKLSSEIRKYLHRRSPDALLHFSIDSEYTEVALMEGTFPIGQARTEIQLRLKRLTELTS
ncbi:MAG: hypothetical protein ACYC1I_12035 [Acidimicrobiales bacterium]